MKIKNDEFITDCHYGVHTITEEIAPGIIWCAVCGAINRGKIDDRGKVLFEKPAIAAQQAFYHWGTRKGRDYDSTTKQ